MENPPLSIILMAVSNCIIPEQQVAPAAGVAALAAAPRWPGFTGQGLVRTQAPLLVNESGWAVDGSDGGRTNDLWTLWGERTPAGCGDPPPQALV